MALTKTQIDSLIDRNCKSDSVSYPVIEKTEDENIAMARVWDIIFKSSTTWNYDDNNHDDYPVITTGLVQGQRDYTFVTDEQGNLILDIFKVTAVDKNGRFYDMLPVDIESQPGLESFYDGQNIAGQPFRYDKMANGILLDSIPSFSYPNGLKIYINREGSYFLVTDTTKMAGFAGLFHEYLALVPSWMYCKRNKMFDLADRYERDMMTMEDKITNYYSQRTKDERTRIIPKYRSSR